MRRTPLPQPVAVLCLLGSLVLVATLLLAGCSGNTADSARSKSPTDAETGFAPGSDEASDAREGRTVGYFADGAKLVPVRLEARADDPVGTLEALCAGPTEEAVEASYTTAIPAGTRALDVTVDGDTATVDLSSEFASGSDSPSMKLRVAQVVFTLTKHPAVKEVRFEVDGKPVSALGDSGLSITKPQTRADWEEFSPEVLVESPVLGDTVSSPLTITGSARVPASRFKLAIAGADGFQVVSATTTATAEVGVRGDFERTLEFELPAGAGTVVTSYAAPGGTRVPSMEVPVLVR